MRRQVCLVARGLLAVVAAAALVAQLRSSVAHADHGPGLVRATVVNFFSYFTVDSNLLAAVALAVGVVVLARRDGPEPRAFTEVRLAVTTYVVLTGLVYNTLLRQIEVTSAVVGWSNEVLHVVVPVGLALDWFLTPGRNPVGPRAALLALVFPLVWVVYTLVRGPFAVDPVRHLGRWYPYPFLNPYTSSGGYASVAAYVVGITILVTGVAFALAWTTRRWRVTGS